jgi:hypothetical protein
VDLSSHFYADPCAIPSVDDLKTTTFGLVVAKFKTGGFETRSAIELVEDRLCNGRLISEVIILYAPLGNDLSYVDVGTEALEEWRLCEPSESRWCLVT